MFPRTGVYPPDGLPRHQRASTKRHGRWLIEQFHREAKQLTGLQVCQCRLARSQRNHIALALRTWTSLKRVAYQTGQTVYQLKQGLLDDYLRRELAQPTLLGLTHLLAAVRE